MPTKEPKYKLDFEGHENDEDGSIILDAACDLFHSSYKSYEEMVATWPVEKQKHLMRPDVKRLVEAVIRRWQRDEDLENEFLTELKRRDSAYNDATMEGLAWSWYNKYPMEDRIELEVEELIQQYLKEANSNNAEAM